MELRSQNPTTCIATWVYKPSSLGIRICITVFVVLKRMDQEYMSIK